MELIMTGLGPTPKLVEREVRLEETLYLKSVLVMLCLSGKRGALENLNALLKVEALRVWFM
jgi:hypothetical protein